MLAKIVKINDKTVVLKGRNGKFATVSKQKLPFKYALGDKITIENDDGKLYFLPYDNDDFDEMTASSHTSHKPDMTPRGHIDGSFLNDGTSNSPNNDGGNKSALVAVIISIGLAIIGWFVAFYLCLGGAIAATVWAFTASKQLEQNREVFNVLMVINIVAWIAEIIVAFNGVAL